MRKIFLALPVFISLTIIVLFISLATGSQSAAAHALPDANQPKTSPWSPPQAAIAAASSALDWIQAQQNITTGGYGTASDSVESLLAIASNGVNPSHWFLQADSPSLSGYLILNGAAYTTKGTVLAGKSGKLMVGLAGSESCWPTGAKDPSEFYSATTGIYDAGSIYQAWAMLGVRSMNQTVPAAAVNYLKSQEQANGGWEFYSGYGADTNTTALAIEALIAAGEPLTSSVIISGFQYIKSAQNTDGGFTYDPNSVWGTDSDTNSTAYAVQAILAAGQDPTGADWTVNSNTPIDYLLAMQLTDGSFEWMPGYGANTLATQQAVPALLGIYYPIKTTGVANCPLGMIPYVTFDQE